MAGAQLSIDVLIERYGFARLRRHAAPPPTERPVCDLVTVDEHRYLDDVTRPLVLGIGIEDPAGVEDAWRRWSDLGAAALMVRESAIEGAEVNEPTRSGTTLLVIGTEISWVRLASLVTADLERSGDGRLPRDLDVTDSLPPGRRESDLYDIADSLASLVDGPVTIEDPESRILAFSSDQDRADEHRKRSILERRVSDTHNAELRRSGVFRELLASPRPIFIVPPIESARPRAAIRIRSGDETLGSIWAVVDGPLTPGQENGMIEAAGVIALSIMRTRLLDEARHHERHQLISHLLEGGRAALESALKLGLADGSTYVAALRHRRSADDEVTHESHVRSLARLLSTFVTSINRRAVIAPLDSTIYAVIPFGDRHADPRDHRREAQRFGSNLLDRLVREDVVLGFGDLVGNPSQLSASRRQADAAVRALLRQPERDARRVAYWRDVQVESLLVEIADSMAARYETIAAPLDRLSDEDQIRTLEAYLEHFGDVAAAAGSLFVHPNTFRYRLRRLAARAEIDLTDPSTRFALMLQLRLRDHHRRPTEEGPAS